MTHLPVNLYQTAAKAFSLSQSETMNIYRYCCAIARCPHVLTVSNGPPQPRALRELEWTRIKGPDERYRYYCPHHVDETLEVISHGRHRLQEVD